MVTLMRRHVVEFFIRRAPGPTTAYICDYLGVIPEGASACMAASSHYYSESITTGPRIQHLW